MRLSYVLYGQIEPAPLAFLHSYIDMAEGLAAVSRRLFLGNAMRDLSMVWCRWTDREEQEAAPLVAHHVPSNQRSVASGYLACAAGHPALPANLDLETTAARLCVSVCWATLRVPASPG